MAAIFQMSITQGCSVKSNALSPALIAPIEIPDLPKRDKTFTCKKNLIKYGIYIDKLANILIEEQQKKQQ
jgi:hypothetical protein